MSAPDARPRAAAGASPDAGRAPAEPRPAPAPRPSPPPAARLDPDAIPALTPFAGTVGIRFLSADPAEVTARMPWAPERCTVDGVLHGGALSTLCDAVAGVCAYLNLPPGARTATAELKVHFLRPVLAGAVTAAARPLHVGPTVIVLQAEALDDAGHRVAFATQTQVVLR
ncbi:MAG TPA: PaaI family thioesterase [Pilimelia sp.]|nr:PaaI family thioesterase [Pilimelia sp.]